MVNCPATPMATALGVSATPLKSSSFDLCAHPEHHRLHDEQDEPFVPQIEVADLEQLRRINHPRYHGHDDPRRELVAAQLGNEA